MNPVIEAIKARRSVRAMTPEVPPRDTLEAILEAATWAPNHHLTEPWRFVVIAGEDRLQLGEAMARALERSLKKDDPRNDEILKAEKQKPLRSPVIIAVVSSPKTGDDKVVELEETVAAGAALQNLLLAAQSLGLGTMVRTGKHSFEEPVREYLRMKANEKLVGLVYTGYASEPSRPSNRKPVHSIVEWRGM